MSGTVNMEDDVEMNHDKENNDKKIFIKIILQMQERILDLVMQVTKGDMPVEDLFDLLHAFEMSILKNEALRQERRENHVAEGMASAKAGE